MQHGIGMGEVTCGARDWSGGVTCGARDRNGVGHMWSTG